MKLTVKQRLIIYRKALQTLNTSSECIFLCHLLRYTTLDSEFADYFKDSVVKVLQEFPEFASLVPKDVISPQRELWWPEGLISSRIECLQICISKCTDEIGLIITPSDRLLIYTQALASFKDRQGPNYLCGLLREVARSLGYLEFVFRDDVTNLLPEFASFEPISKYDDDRWWDVDNRELRISCLEQCITNVQKLIQDRTEK